jgi:2-amino-4-hydroxy-6-hydroxymethyldihydropteridine diphosphokinase
MMSQHTAIVCVGSNMGDKCANCKKGIDALQTRGGCQLLGQSRFFRTTPVDRLDQDWFVNAALCVQTRLEPEALLAQLKDIERWVGRRETVRFGPRVLDLDIIFFDALVMQTPGLVLPHPRMHKRRFVLEPICDINPKIYHPIFKKSVRQLLDALDDPTQEVVEYRCGS